MEGNSLVALNEAKSRWPEAASSGITSGEQLLARASFQWALYEQALLKALQDLLAATSLLPGFAQVDGQPVPPSLPFPLPPHTLGLAEGWRRP